MKSYSFTLFAAFAVFTLAACGKKAQAEPQPQKDSVAVAHDTVVEKPKEESLTFQTFSKKLKTKHFAYNTKFVLAQSNSNPNLANSINEWVNEQLGGKYQGNLNDGDAMLNYYQKRWVREEERDVTNSENNFAISKVYETEQFITLEAETYWYGGGAHGGSSLVGATFRKSDGRKFDKSMIGNEKMLRHQLIRGLIKALEVSNKEELSGVLQCSAIDGYDDVETRLALLPLPEAEPWLTKKGMQLVYQQYEIAPYAAGSPSVLIPLVKLYPMLNASGKTYLK